MNDFDTSYFIWLFFFLMVVMFVLAMLSILEVGIFKDGNSEGMLSMTAFTFLIWRTYVIEERIRRNE